MESNLPPDPPIEAYPNQFTPMDLDLDMLELDRHGCDDLINPYTGELLMPFGVQTITYTRAAGIAIDNMMGC